MSSSLPSLANPTLMLVATYLLHSALWLAAVWVTLKLCKRSWTVSERLWRWAAVLPFVTTCGYLIGNERPALWTWTVPSVTAVMGSHDKPAARAALPVVSHKPDIKPNIIRPAPTEGPLIPGSTVPYSESIAADVIAPEEPVFQPLSASPVATKEQAANTHAVRPSETDSVVVAESNIQSCLVVSTVSLVLLWMGIGLMRVLVISIWSWRQIRRMSLVSSGTAFTILHELRETHDLKSPVRLISTNHVNEPAACGLWNWTIIIPREIEQQLDDAELRAALTHELAHLVRGDVLWMWAGRLLTAAFGWQPMNRLAVRRWREASEHLCDDWTIDRGVSPVTLAKCLTRVAEWKLLGHDPATALTLGGRRSLLTQRIKRLTTPRQPDRWQSRKRRRLLTLGLLVATTLLTWTGPHITWAVTDEATQVTTTSADSLPPPEIKPAQESRPLPQRSSMPDRSAIDDLNALRHDLAYALDLLSESESGEEIAALVNQIRQRLDALKVDQIPQE